MRGMSRRRARKGVAVYGEGKTALRGLGKGSVAGWGGKIGPPRGRVG